MTRYRFSAFWLRSSVVSVLISLISDTSSIRGQYIKWIFGAGGWNRSLLRPLHASTWYCSTSRNGAPPTGGKKICGSQRQTGFWRSRRILLLKIRLFFLFVFCFSVALAVATVGLYAVVPFTGRSCYFRSPGRWRLGDSQPGLGPLAFLRGTAQPEPRDRRGRKPRALFSLFVCLFVCSQ